MGFLWLGFFSGKPNLVNKRTAQASEDDEKQRDKGGDRLDQQGGGRDHLTNQEDHLLLLDHLLPPPPPPLTFTPLQVNLGHALFFAALLDRLQIVETLLEKGAQVILIKFLSKTQQAV